MPLEPFERVVAEHGPTVLRVCRALLGPVDAQDAWSETFLSALRAYPDLRPGSNVRGWLVTIAHRKAIDQLRWAQRAPLPVGDPPEAPSAGEPPPAAEADTALLRALADLPFKQRCSVVYRYLGDLSYDEVGALLECTPVAARRNAADGIAKLRTTYGGDRWLNR